MNVNKLRQRVIEELDATLQKIADRMRNYSVNAGNKDNRFYIKADTIGYDICDRRSDKCLYKNIYDVDFAKKIVNYLICGRKQSLARLLAYECEYSKYINDMTFYVHAMKQTNDVFRRKIMEDRFDIAKEEAIAIKKKSKVVF